MPRLSAGSAVLRRDYPVIQGALLVISGVYVLINFGIDILYDAEVLAALAAVKAL